MLIRHRLLSNLKRFDRRSLFSLIPTSNQSVDKKGRSYLWLRRSLYEILSLITNSTHVRSGIRDTPTIEGGVPKVHTGIFFLPSFQ